MSKVVRLAGSTDQLADAFRDLEFEIGEVWRMSRLTSLAVERDEATVITFAAYRLCQMVDELHDKYYALYECGPVEKQKA